MRSEKGARLAFRISSHSFRIIGFEIARFRHSPVTVLNLKLFSETARKGIYRPSAGYVRCSR